MDHWIDHWLVNWRTLTLDLVFLDGNPNFRDVIGKNNSHVFFTVTCSKIYFPVALTVSLPPVIAYIVEQLCHSSSEICREKKSQSI